jgi:tetratricopeptide (TPR) repeat protein
MNQFEYGYALLIGVDQCAVDKWSLPGVRKDIEALNDVLKDPERCAYPEKHIKVLTGSNAIKDEIDKGLNWLKECIEADYSDSSTVIIYFSGHGMRSNSGASPQFYLIPHEVEENKIAATAFPAKEFSQKIEAMKPRRLLVILDCCHAGGMDVKDIGFIPGDYLATAIPHDQVLGGKNVPGDNNQITIELEKGFGRAVLSSSTGTQKSFMRKDKDMSIFTYHLIEALTGHAQPKEGSKEVLITDIMSHVTRRVPESAWNDWGQEQDPSHHMMSINFPIALLLGGEGKSLTTKLDEIVAAGLEYMELQEYREALVNFQKARELMPEDEKIKLYYIIAYLSERPILARNKGDMNRLTVSLIKIKGGNDLSLSILSRLILGVVWFDYYIKVDHTFQEMFFKSNARYLGKYQPSYEEKKMVNHIAITESAKSMFNLT